MTLPPPRAWSGRGEAWSLLPLRVGSDDPVGELMTVEVSGTVRGNGGVDFFSSPTDLVGGSRTTRARSASR